MKIAVLSPNPKHLQDATSVLRSAGHEVIAAEGGKSHLPAVAQRERPDLIIADGICCDTQELEHIEHVTSHHPRMAVVLMCSSHTPEYLLNAMRAGVREVLPSPTSADALLAAVQRIATKLGAGAAGKNGKVLAFMPCKGGAGATFLATNVSWELALTRRVLLVDLNLQFGDALSFVHDGRPASTLADVAASTDRLDGSLLVASALKVTEGLHVLAAPDDPGQALEIQAEHIEAILGVAIRHFDFVVLDLSRTLDTCAIKALDRATNIFPVLQPTLPGIRHATKLRQAFHSLDYAPPKVQFIVNACQRGAEIGAAEVQRALGGTRVLALPDAAADVTASINHGEPLLKASRSHPLARQIIELVKELDPQPEEQHKGLFDRIFRRAA
jgi:pilus assembly protein CpaE